MKNIKIIFFLSLIIVLLVVMTGCKNEQVSFNKNTWLLSSGCKPVDKANLRFEMIDDLTTNLLANKDREAIQELLGDSEASNVLLNVKRDFIYCLGRSYGLTMNWLLIHLDENNKYKGFEIVKAD